MSAGVWIQHYEWSGGREAMLRVGPDNGPVVIVAPPLFEEANRTRALLVAVLRGLAARGIAGVLPDLPGQGESAVPTSDARLGDWRDAFAAAARHTGGPRHGLAVRGGALVDGDADLDGRLHLSPRSGSALVRDLLRTRHIAAIAAGERPPADDPARPGPPMLLAGHRLDRELLRELLSAEPSRADTVLSVFTDPGEADRRLVRDSGAADPPRFRAPWLASEPSADPALAAVLTDEVATWIRSCASC